MSSILFCRFFQCEFGEILRDDYLIGFFVYHSFCTFQNRPKALLVQTSRRYAATVPTLPVCKSTDNSIVTVHINIFLCAADITSAPRLAVPGCPARRWTNHA